MMKPVIEVHSVGSDAYTYRISAFAAGAATGGDYGTFASLEQCLFDAGASLGQYFTRVELNLNGLFIGQYATESLRRNPKVVAQRMRQHFQPAQA